MRAFREKASGLGPGHVDYVCTSKGCPWHKVVAMPAVNPTRVLADLRTHALEHRALTS